MRAGRLAFSQQLELRADRRHDRPASERVAILVDRAVLLQRRVGVVPCILELRRVRLGPVLARELSGRLHHLRVHLVEIRVERVHQRDVEPVLPDALRAAGVDAVVVPGAVRRQDQVARVERHALAIDGGIGAPALHDEAQRRSLMAVRGGELAGIHHLHTGIEETGCSAPLLAARIDEHHDAARGLLGRHQLRRAAHEGLDAPPLPERRH